MASPETVEVKVRDGVESKLLVAGEGKPVVFLHGAGGLNWDPYLDELSRHYKVYAPYLPGTGGTTGNKELRDLWDLLLFYYDLFDALGLEQVDLIGHSFGGMVAAELAAMETKRVKHLILLCPAGLWKDDLPPEDVFAVASVPEELFAKLFADVNSSAAKLIQSLPEDPEEQKNVLLEQQVVLSEVGKYLWPIPDKGLSRRMYRIKANTCIVWGEQDGLIPVQYAYEFQNRIKGSQLKIFKNAAHFPQLEQLEEVVKLTLDFIAPDYVTH